MNLRIFALAGISAMLITGSTTLAQTPPDNDEGPPAATYGHHHRGTTSGMRKAERSLSREISNLEQDPHDYGGHRAAALNLLRQAQSEIRAGLASERQDRTQ